MSGQDRENIDAQEPKAWDGGWKHYFTATSHLFAICAANGIFREMNPAWERTLGYSTEELCSRPFIELVHPEDRESTARAFAGIVERNEFDGLINRYQRKGGDYATISWKSVVRVGELYYAVAQDITASEAALAAQRAAHARMEYLLNASGVVLFSIDREKIRTSYISENVRDCFGYEPEEFINDGMLWRGKIHPDDRPDVLAALEELRRGISVSREYRFMHKDGSYRWTQGDIRILRGADGSVTELIGTWQDISARKNAERTIQEQASALRALSTPLIPVSDEILVMPLVGVMDAQRADQVMITLLSGITASRARWAILDITGIAGMDALAADALVRASNAARLLGVRVVLTGIRPDVAQTLIALDVDMKGILTFGTLQAGIQHAMRCAAQGSPR
jgi:rsbT co-antagonist protein RsbR